MYYLWSLPPHASCHTYRWCMNWNCSNNLLLFINACNVISTISNTVQATRHYTGNMYLCICDCCCWLTFGWAVEKHRARVSFFDTWPWVIFEGALWCLIFVVTAWFPQDKVVIPCWWLHYIVLWRSMKFPVKDSNCSENSPHPTSRQGIMRLGMRPATLWRHLI